MKRIIWVAAIVGLVAAGARGDGCYIAIQEVGRSSQMAASPKQEAVLVFDGSTVEVSLRTHFRAGPKELAWVIPVPDKPADIRAGEEEIFKDLEQETAPQFYRVEYRGKVPFTCSSGAGRVAVGPGVVVEATGTAGIFEWTVLSATGAGELMAWLAQNQYAIPVGAERVMEKYVGKGWYWLAIKVRPEVSDKPNLAPHPIVYSYADTQLVYPLIISQLSADLENEIVLYVLAKGRMAPANWPSKDILDFAVKQDKASRSGTNYEERIRRTTDEEGGHLFVTEFAADLDTGGYRPLLKRLTGIDPLSVADVPTPYLTRLRAVMAPKAMDRDVVLAVSARQDSVANHIGIASRETSATLKSALLGLAGAALLAARFLITDDSLGTRCLGVAALLAGLLALALF